MTATIRSEWIKLRTLRGSWVLAGIAVAFPVLVGVLYAVLVGVEEMDPDELYDAVIGGSLITTMLLGVLGATNITAEYGTNLIRPTFAATPRRVRVLLAKAVVLAVTAVVVQGLASLVALTAGSAVASARDVELELLDLDGLWSAVLGQLLFVALVACLGLGFGVIVRATPAAVALVILWPMLVESLVGGLLGLAFEDAANWMPYGAGTALHALDPDPESLGRLGGGLLFAGFVAVVLGVGAVLSNRRDA
jgi:ABC-2 type transport system permease protein